MKRTREFWITTGVSGWATACVCALVFNRIEDWTANLIALLAGGTFCAICAVIGNAVEDSHAEPLQEDSFDAWDDLVKWGQS